MSLFQVLKWIFLLGLLYIAKWMLEKRKVLARIGTNTPAVFFLFTAGSDIYTRLSTWCNTAGALKNGFHHFWLGPVLGVVAADPDAVKFLLTQRNGISKQFERLPIIVRPWLTKGLVAVDGDDWSRQRSVFAPAFTTAAYNTYYPIFVQTVTKLLDVIEQRRAPSGDMDIKPSINHWTIDTLGLSIFHHDFELLSGIETDYLRAYRDVMADGISNLALMGLPWLEHLTFLPFMQRLIKGKAKLTELFKKMIHEHRTIPPEKRGGANILDRMLDGFDQEKLSDEELESNLFIFFVAGHDTTYTALCWVVLALVKYPALQKELRAKVLNRFGTDLPKFENLQDVPEIDWFINETMRVYPPLACLLTRAVTEDIQLEGGMLLPKGVVLGMNIIACHMNPEVWEEPQKFDPTRFSPERSKGRHKFAYLPFSLGSRQCIGNNFSMAEQRLFLIRLLQRFDLFEPRDSVFSMELGSDVTFNIPASVRVNVQPRPL